MAIGARITSNNLSGKTATVTFVPYTGSTSGSTQNLGSQTIPFNNITAHPYGVYSLYFAEYDYTYTLTVPEPITSVQSFAILAPLTGSTNYGIGFLNFNDLSATILDLNIDSSIWTINDQYPIQDKGYAYHFYQSGDWNTKLVVFTDATNNVLASYSATTTNYGYDDLDGAWNIFYDRQAGIAHYSNGEEVFTYNWDASLYYFDFDWNNYTHTKDKSLIFILTNMDSGISTSYNVSYHNDITEMESWDTNQFNKNYWQCPTHTFVPSITWDNYNGIYNDIKFFDTSGVQIGQTIDLSQYGYNNYNAEQYGLNRFVIVFYNYNDFGIDYRIIHFDGETNTLINTTTPRGNEYQEITVQADDNLWINDDVANCMYIAFYNPIGWTNNVTVDYCKIMYMLSGQTSLNTYDLATGSSITTTFHRPYSIIGIPFVDSDNVAKFLSFNNSGAQILSTAIANDGSTDFWRYNINGLGYISILWNNSYDGGNIIVMTTPGVQSASMPFTLGGSWQYRNSAVNGIFVFGDQTNTYYINTTSNGFVTLSGEDYNNNYYSNIRYAENNLSNDMVWLMDNNTGNGRLITSTAITNIFTLPDNNGSWSIALGEDHLMFIFGDPSDNTAHANLYDRNLTLVNSMSTAFTDWNTQFAVKDRYVVVFFANGYVTSYMLTPTNVSSVVLSDTNTNYTVNDYYYWAD